MNRVETSGRRRIGALFLTLFAIVIVLGAAWAWAFFSDGALPDDADLRRSPHSFVPDRVNSYLAWVDAMSESAGSPPLVWSWRENPPRFGELETSPRQSNSREGEAWFRSTAGVYSGLREALVEEGFQFRSWPLSSTIETCFECLDFAAAIEFARGDAEEAWEWTEVAKEWNRRFWEALGDQTVVLAEKSTPIGDARLRIAQMMPEDLSLLRSFLLTTENSELPPRWREDFLLTQYAFLFQQLQKKLPIVRSEFPPPPEWAKSQFRVHRTLRLLASWTRTALDEAEAGGGAIDLFATARAPGGWVSRGSKLALGNARGEWRLRIAFRLPDEAPGVESIRAIEFGEAATRTLLALRIHRAERGSWPETLDALVPSILPRLPRDPFDPDRGPLRYDATREVIYSLGKNGRDDGGLIDHDERRTSIVEGFGRVVPLSFPEAAGGR